MTAGGSSAAPAAWLALAIRALVEMRRSRGGALSLALATAALLAAASTGLWLQPDLDVAQVVMLSAGLRMIGHLLLFFSVGLYARHVILDAEGRLKRQEVAAAKCKSPRKNKACDRGRERGQAQIDQGRERDDRSPAEAARTRDRSANRS